MLVDIGHGTAPYRCGGTTRHAYLFFKDQNPFNVGDIHAYCLLHLWYECALFALMRTTTIEFLLMTVRANLGGNARLHGMGRRLNQSVLTRDESFRSCFLCWPSLSVSVL